jgi:hypothetical protein
MEQESIIILKKKKERGVAPKLKFSCGATPSFYLMKLMLPH